MCWAESSLRHTICIAVSVDVTTIHGASWYCEPTLSYWWTYRHTCSTCVHMQTHTHMQSHIDLHTHTHTHTHSSYMPMAYFMMAQLLPVAGKLPIKTKVARQLPTHTHTHTHTHTLTHTKAYKLLLSLIKTRTILYLNTIAFPSYFWRRHSRTILTG